MKTVTYTIKDRASEMTKRELIEHFEHELIVARCTIADDGDGHPTAEEKLEELEEQLSELLRLVRE
jgi:hypothetical protein